MYIWSQHYRFIDFDHQLPFKDWKLVDTGTTEESVRRWGQELVRSGYHKKGKNFHVNLLAKHIHATL